MIETVESI